MSAVAPPDAKRLQMPGLCAGRLASNWRCFGDLERLEGSQGALMLVQFAWLEVVLAFGGSLPPELDWLAARF